MSDHDLPALRARIQDIDHEIESLEDRIAALRVDREPIAAVLDAVVYPVLSLPTEITAHIFTHYVDSPHIGRQSSFRDGTLPLTLGAVCRDWRQISLFTSSLWADFKIRAPPSSAHEREFEVFFALLQHFLRHAGTHPLRVFVEGRLICPSPSFNTSLDCITRIQSVLSPYWPQMASLDLVVEPPSAPFKLMPRYGVPALRALSLQSSPGLSDWRCGDVHELQDAPMLCSVSMDGLSMASVTLPWRQLTHLEFGSESMYNCLAILCQTPLLENLRYASLSQRPIAGSTPRIITLARLCSLEALEQRVEPQEGIQRNCVLDYLIAPALTSLRLASTTTESVSAFAARSNFTLRHARLRDIDEDNMFRFLKNQPHLEDLELDIDFWQSGCPHQCIAQVARELGTNTTFLPNLRTLEVLKAEKHLGALARSIAARWRGELTGVVPLRRLGLHLTEDAEKSFVAVLRPLMRIGFELFLRAPDED
uniref:F-box domain-containing protein n=1 Tax=Mycena chlorophos TaxID=658473 RepID=A0ABQ0MGE0_MYCCL|nr:predicted protein [Mycena chlorophos]